MLHEFIAAHRELIIARTREHVASRKVPMPTEVEIVHGVPLFLEQLEARLQTEVEAGATEIGASASLHGAELLKKGLTVGQVVRDYGDICQAITELAVERGAEIATEDFRILNLCLDIAIAEAVTEYARARELGIVAQGVEHLGFLAHELRNLLGTAQLAYEALTSGDVGIAGSTGRLLGKSLDGMRDLVTRSLAEVRLEAGPPHREPILVRDLLDRISIAAGMQARARAIQLMIEPAEPGLTVEGDSQILTSIVINLVQNACKFTPEHGHVTLRTRATADRVFFDVTDECGGLPAGTAERLFQPYQQHGTDRRGLGLGLALSMRGAKACGGDITVRDIPATGCVFTVDLRRSTAS